MADVVGRAGEPLKPGPLRLPVTLEAGECDRGVRIVNDQRRETRVHEVVSQSLVDLRERGGVAVSYASAPSLALGVLIFAAISSDGLHAY